MGVGDLPLDRMHERGMWPPGTKRIGAGNVESTTGLITPIWPVDPLGSYTFHIDNRASRDTPILHAGINKFQVPKDNNLVKVIQQIDFRITNPSKFLALNDVRLSAFVEGSPIREFSRIAVGNGARIRTKVVVPPHSSMEIQVSVPALPTPLPVPTYDGRHDATGVQYNGRVYVFGGMQNANLALAVVDYLVSNDNGVSWEKKPYSFVLAAAAGDANCNVFVWKDLVYLFVQEMVAGVRRQSIYTFDGNAFKLKLRYPGAGPVTTAGDAFYFNYARGIAVDPVTGRWAISTAFTLYYSDDEGVTWINPGLALVPGGFEADSQLATVIAYEGSFYLFMSGYDASVGSYFVGIFRVPVAMPPGSGVPFLTNVPTVEAAWVLQQNGKVYITNGYGIKNLYTVPLGQMQSKNWYLEASNEPYMNRYWFVAMVLDNGSVLFVTGIGETTPYVVPSFKDFSMLGLMWYCNVNGIKLPLKHSVQRTLITP